MVAVYQSTVAGALRLRPSSSFSSSSPPPQHSKMEKDKSLVWDCGSSLYDSFELKCFMQQLDSAIASRTMSMPHLSRSSHPPPPQARKKPSKLFRSLHRLLRSVLHVPSMLKVQVRSHEHKDRTPHQKPGRLASIPETSEKEAAASPEIRASVRKTMSARFTRATAPPPPALS
ncbi:hypothetical protein BHE74_00056327 [Ensete ventricosum]|nr:hypothetical protein BHE74_00056327 [Ensete ventricosum]